MTATAATPAAAPAPAARGAELAVRDRRPLGWKIVTGGVIVACYVIAAVFAPLIAPHSPLTMDVYHRLSPPSPAHWLGTDELGRDELSRLIWAARIDLPVALGCVALPALVGTLLGAIAGFAGSWADAVIMRVVDLVQAFPLYILMLALVFAMGPGVRSLLISFAAVDWVVYARLVRGEILRIREQDYVAAARTAGLSWPRVLIVHILPNAVRQAIVYATSDLVFAMLALAAFSFLGLGIAPPTAEWGAMIAGAQAYAGIAWWTAVFPGLALTGITMGLALIGDGVQDRMTG
jgi:peptide/nickel transport system permease protein